MASFKASHPKRHNLTLARTGGEGRSLDPCTSQGPMETRGEKINVSSGPSKEIAGLTMQKREYTLLHSWGYT